MQLSFRDYSVWVEYFLLIWLRVTGLFIMSPVFGRRNQPNIHKIGFSFVLTYILTNMMLFEDYPRYTGMFEYTFACIKELLLGISIGYITTVFFSLAITAGKIMDNQIGFGLADVFDVNINSQMPLLGNFFNFLILLMFFALDGHQVLIKFLFNSFNIIPPGQAVINTNIGIMIINAFVYTFTLAVQLSIPLIAAALILEAALGVLIRTVPQMNIFIVGIPLRIGVGLIVLFLVIPVYLKCFGNIFDKMFVYIDDVFKVLVSS